MKRYNDTRCAAIVNGKRCGLSPSSHGVETRSKLGHLLGVKLVGHSFMLALNAKVSETDDSPAT